MTGSSSPRFILHAGMYKTATSTIQTLMAKHRGHVARRYGILYPKTGTRRNTGSGNRHSVAHHLLYHAVRDDNGSGPNARAVAMLRDRLQAEVAESGARTVVLCSELFTNSSPAAKTAFLELLGGGEAEIVFSIRRPDDYAESVVNQAHKNLREPSISAARPLPVLRNIEEWQALVGADRVRILAFTKADYRGYLQRVFGLFGIDPEDPMIDTTLHDNPAMTLTGYLLRRTLVRMLQARGQKIDREMRHKLNVLLDEMEQHLPKSPKAQFLGPEDRAAAMAANAEQMERIVALMTPDEAAAMRRELERPASDAPPNAGTYPPMTPAMLAEIYERFGSGYIAKCLAGQAGQAKG